MNKEESQSYDKIKVTHLLNTLNAYAWDLQGTMPEQHFIGSECFKIIKLLEALDKKHKEQS